MSVRFCERLSRSMRGYLFSLPSTGSHLPLTSLHRFSPLLGVEALGTRVEGVVLVVEMRLTVNLQALTLEQQLSKRWRLVQQMCDNIKQELKADLRSDEWLGLAKLQRQGDDFNGHTHAEATLEAEMVAVARESPDYYNSDTAWGSAIARAVAASSQVGAWPGALQTLCKAVSLDPEKLMQRTDLVFRLRKFGCAEAEVIELLLKVSPALHALTLHDGGPEGQMDEATWQRCTEALARGIAAAPQLHTLNLRHVSLHGAAGGVMAAALRGSCSLKTLRLANNGLDETALTILVSGNDQLRTLLIQDNPMPGSKLEALAVLLGSSPNLQSLGLPGCKIGPIAGHNLAEALGFATGSGLPLFHLELANNALNSTVGEAPVTALQGNCRLTELTHASSSINVACARGTAGIALPCCHRAVAVGRRDGLG